MPEEPTDQLQKFSARIKGGQELECQCDCLAMHGGLVYMFGLVAPAGTAKQMRAMLHERSAPLLRCSAPLSATRSFSYERCSSSPPAPGDWKVLAHRLGHDMVHALFINQSPGFLPVLDDTSLYRVLMGPSYTTPILPHWIPWLRQRMQNSCDLHQAASWRCQAGYIGVSQNDLDVFVETGIAEEHLILEDPQVARALTQPGVEP